MDTLDSQNRTSEPMHKSAIQPNTTQNDFSYIIGQPHRFTHIPVKQIWQYRELLVYLVRRDLRVRYTQSVIGVGWAVIKPLLMMLMFALVFGMIIQVPTGPVPYQIFVYAGLLAWTAFSTIVTIVSGSIIYSSTLLNKIYFPRLLIPLSASVSPVIDFLISIPIFIVFMIVSDVPLSPQFILLPVFVVLVYLLALGLGLWLAALHVRYHDIGQLVPILMQLWMYASPIIYPIDIVPAHWLTIYSLNPSVGIIRGFQWVLLDTPPPTELMMASTIVWILLLVTTGLFFFQYSERSFADIV